MSPLVKMLFVASLIKFSLWKINWHWTSGHAWPSSCRKFYSGGWKLFGLKNVHWSRFGGQMWLVFFVKFYVGPSCGEISWKFWIFLKIKVPPYFLTGILSKNSNPSPFPMCHQYHPNIRISTSPFATIPKIHKHCLCSPDFDKICNARACGRPSKPHPSPVAWKK